MARGLRRVASLLALVACALGLVTGCGSTRVAQRATVDWPAWDGNAQNTRDAQIAQVDPANVGRLALVWKRAEGPEQFGWETFPVVVGTTMYYTTNTDAVIAVSATTGRTRWTYDPQVNFIADPLAVAVEPVNRGVTVAGGRVYEVTYDDQLIALDARSGGLLWKVQVADPASGAAQDSPGVAWHGEIIIGGPEGDAGLRGFVAAYDARTGARLWRTYVIPSPGRGWMAGGRANGGGDVWMPPVVDAVTGTVYAATGNPSPAFSTATRPGCDRWTDATVAIDARTGRLKWGYSATCGDAWDYDVDQSPVLFSLDGRRVLADASKSGFIYFLNRRTGALLRRSPSLVRYTNPHRPPTRSGAFVCPGIFGGIEYGPSAYSSQTHLLYVGATNACERYRTLPGGSRGPEASQGLGGSVTLVPGATGLVAAIDPHSGAIAWRHRLPEPIRGGVLATSGGLVLAGDDDGYLYVFNARSGAVLRRIHLGLRFGSAPLSYAIAGRQYIAVAAGGSSADESGAGLARTGGELDVYALAPAQYR